MDDLDLFSISPKQTAYNGPEYVPDRDYARLVGQTLRIFDLMKDGKWRSLSAIEEVTRDPATSISAQLRHLRKEKFGAHTINRRRVGAGFYEYQLIANAGAPK